ncbi:MAG: ABC transporter substrate-binding protein [Euryarchaeota archaeon]|nr:ABC transporter substrate-binding protein [Euryarchaeota archaeon]
MNISKPLAIGVAAVVIIAAVAGIIILTHDDDDRVKIGYLTGDLHQISHLVMMDKSLFGDESLLEKYEVDAVSANPGGYANGGAVMDAIAAGSVDIAWLGAPPVIQKHLNAGTDVKIIAVANSEGSSIVVKDGIDSVEDLRGKTVATPGPASIQHLLFMEVIENAGMKTVQKGAETGPNIVYWKQLPPVNQKAALEKGDVDAAVGWEPYGSAAITDGTAKILEWSGEVWPDHPCCVVAVRTSYAEANPDIVAKVIKAHIDATEWIEETVEDKNSENYTKLVDMSKTFSGINDEKVIDSALSKIKYKYQIDEAFRTSLDGFTESYIDLDVIKSNRISERGYSSVKDFVDKIIDTSYLERAEEMVENNIA